MSWDQIQQLVAAGWGISSHAVNHTDLTTISTAQAEEELSQSKAALVAHGITPLSFAFPFGAYNGALLARAAQHYQSARAFETGDNPQGVFPYDVKVRAVLNTTTASDISSWLQQAAARKEWVLLVFHRIAGNGDDAYYTTPARFADLIAAVSTSGVPVATYDQVLQLFRAGS